jgi:hypothetical protein
MTKLVDLVEGGVLFQLFLALIVVVTVCFMAIQEREVTPELWATLWVLLGNASRVSCQGRSPKARGKSGSSPSPRGNDTVWIRCPE